MFPEEVISSRRRHPPHAPVSVSSVTGSYTGKDLPQTVPVQPEAQVSLYMIGLLHLILILLFLEVALQYLSLYTAIVVQIQLLIVTIIFLTKKFINTHANPLPTHTHTPPLPAVLLQSHHQTAGSLAVAERCDRGLETNNERPPALTPGVINKRGRAGGRWGWRCISGHSLRKDLN